MHRIMLSLFSFFVVVEIKQCVISSQIEKKDEFKLIFILFASDIALHVFLPCFIFGNQFQCLEASGLVR